MTCEIQPTIESGLMRARPQFLESISITSSDPNEINIGTSPANILGYLEEKVGILLVGQTTDASDQMSRVTPRSGLCTGGWNSVEDGAHPTPGNNTGGGDIFSFRFRDGNQGIREEPRDALCQPVDRGNVGRKGVWRVNCGGARTQRAHRQSRKETCFGAVGMDNIKTPVTDVTPQFSERPPIFDRLDFPRHLDYVRVGESVINRGKAI